MSITVLFITSLMVLAIQADQRLMCASWSGIERALIHDAQQVNCSVSSNCSGITCSIHQFGYDITGGISINSCETPPSLSLSMDVPKLNIKKWQKKFYHGDNFSLSESLDGVIEIHQQDDKYILGLSLDIPSGIKSDSPLLHLIPSLASSTRYHIFENITVFAPACVTLNNSKTITQPTSEPFLSSPAMSLESKSQSNCSILNSSCPLHEMCQQIDKLGPEGLCVCIIDYIRSFTGKCIYSPSVVSTTETPPDHSQPNKKTSTNSLLLTAILVPISVIVIAVALVYFTIRYRVFQHLRRRLRVQVYEHVLLGQEEDDDDEESLNPVA